MEVTWRENRAVAYTKVVTDSPDAVKNTVVKDGIHEQKLELALCEFTEASHDHFCSVCFSSLSNYKAHTARAKFGKRFKVTK